MSGDPKYAVPYGKKVALLASAVKDVHGGSDSRVLDLYSKALVKVLNAGAHGSSTELVIAIRRQCNRVTDDGVLIKKMLDDLYEVLTKVENMLEKNVPR